MSEEATNSSKKICEICNSESSKYCCPRCNILYCSLSCYKSETHTNCSEDFYRDCVNEELSSYQADDESKKKMIQILKKMRASDVDDGFGDNIGEFMEDVENTDSDDEEPDDLAKRIDGLNLDDADALWNALTEDERNEFEALLNQGDVGSILPQWEPWWTHRKEKRKIEDVDKIDDEDNFLRNCPTIKAVPEFSSLTKVIPSPAIRFNITNVIASYAFIMRYFNGELDAVEATSYLLDICANLDANVNYEELALAVESVVQKCLQSELIETDRDSLNVLKKDTILILQGPSEDNKTHYCRATLSHLHYILNEAKSKAKLPKPEQKSQNSTFSKKFPDHKTSHLPNLDISKVKKCIKKVEFYLSYVTSCGMDFE